MTRDMEEAIFMWNTKLDALHSDSIEDEDIYSMALGFFFALGFDIGICHMLASNEETHK